MTMPVRDIPAGMTAEQAAVVASQATYEAQQQALRQQLAAALIAIWAGVVRAGTFSPQAAARFVAQLLPISLGAQRAMVAITMAQLNQQLGAPTPIVIAPASVTGEALRGRDPADYYERPFREIKWRLSQGMSLGEALDAGRRRAEAIAQTDLELAHTHSAREFLRSIAVPEVRPRPRQGQPTPQAPPRPPVSQRGTVVGYRRKLSNKPNHCALCVLASTQRYHVGQLMPIHPNCSCTVELLFSSDFRSDRQIIDPSLAQEVHNIVRRDLGDKYVDAGGRLGDAHYRDIIITNEHGEMGPILGVRGQHFEPDPNRPGRLTHDRINPPDEPDNAQDLDAL